MKLFYSWLEREVESQLLSSVAHEVVNVASDIEELSNADVSAIAHNICHKIQLKGVE